MAHYIGVSQTPSQDLRLNFPALAYFVEVWTFPPLVGVAGHFLEQVLLRDIDATAGLLSRWAHFWAEQSLVRRLLNGVGESSWIVRHGNQINPVGYAQIVGISCNRRGTYRLDRQGRLEPRERAIKCLVFNWSRRRGYVLTYRAGYFFWALSLAHLRPKSDRRCMFYLRFRNIVDRFFVLVFLLVFQDFLL